MRWHWIDREKVSDWTGRFVVTLMLALGVLLMGCGEGEVETGETEPDPRVRSAFATAGEPAVAVQPAARTVDEPVPAREFTGPVRYEVAETVFLEGRYDEARRLFGRYVEERPANPWGHYMLGLAAWKAGSLSDAEGAFRAALELEPTHRKSIHNLSRVFLEDGRPREAEELLRTALEVDSTVAETWRLLGRACDDVGDVESAIAAYRQALTLDDEDVWALNNLGLLYIRRGRFEEALPPLARAVRLRGDVPVFQNNLGIALERTGHYRLAADAYHAALEADAGYAKAARSLARVEGRDDAVPFPVDLERLAEGFVQDLRGGGPGE